MKDLVALGIPESALRDLEFQDPPGTAPCASGPGGCKDLIEEARLELQAVLTLLEEALVAVDADSEAAATLAKRK